MTVSHASPRYVLFSVSIALTLLTGGAQAQTFTMPDSGVPLVVSTCDGLILDPGGAGDFSLGQSGTVVIYPNSPDVVVELEVEQVDIHANDTLDIYGGSVRVNTIGAHSSWPVTQGHVYVGSPDNSGALRLEFSATDGDELAGFAFRVRCETSDNITVGDDRRHDFRGKNLTDSGGFSGPYGPNENLSTTFRHHSPSQMVVDFSSVDLEENFDKIELFNEGGISMGTVWSSNFLFGASKCRGGIHLRPQRSRRRVCGWGSDLPLHERIPTGFLLSRGRKRTFLQSRRSGCVVPS